MDASIMQENSVTPFGFPAREPPQADRPVIGAGGQGERVGRDGAAEDSHRVAFEDMRFLIPVQRPSTERAIQGRDYARIYVKELDRGRASVALSPEEQQAVDRAMSY